MNTKVNHLKDNKPTELFLHGTNICMDLHCPACRSFSHFDGTHAFHVMCPHCETVFETRFEVHLKIVAPDTPNHVGGKRMILVATTE